MVLLQFGINRIDHTLIFLSLYYFDHYTRLIIILVVPFFTSIVVGSGPNRTIFNMTKYLHHINQSNYSQSECSLLETSNKGWLNASNTMLNGLHFKTLPNRKNLVPFAWVANNCTKDGMITEEPPECLIEKGIECFNWQNKPQNLTLNDMYKVLNLRQGSLVEVKHEGTRVVYNLEQAISLS